jgi:ABC-2 type transport system ATP-binding protein
LRSSGGRAEVAGFDVARFPERVREHIGYMSQKFSLYSDLSVMENLRFFGGVYGVKGARLEERLKFAIDMAGLKDRTNALVANLSGGWKQRLALGCAVLHEPAILFLDEPTSGVDPASRRRFWDLIYSLAGNGVCVVITTHYMDEAEYCNRIALIAGGRLAAQGSPGELKRSAIHGEILLVEGDNPGAMLEALQGAPGVRDVAPFGSSLHIVVDEAERDRPAIEMLLKGRGLGSLRIEPSQVGASQIAVVATLLPTRLLSGFAFPIDQMPPVIQAVTYLVPARYYFAILKAVFLKGSGLGDLVAPIALLAVSLDRAGIEHHKYGSRRHLPCTVAALRKARAASSAVIAA